MGEINRADDVRFLFPPKTQGLLEIDDRPRRRARLDQRMLELRGGQMLEKLRSANQLHGKNPALVADEKLIQTRQIAMTNLGKIPELALEASNGFA